MIHLPKGPATGDIVDPDMLADDFIDASQVAGDPTQWQWLTGAFTDRAILTAGSAVKLHYKRQAAQTRFDNLYSTPEVPDDAVCDPQLWKIPYNRGFAPVRGDMTVAGDMLSVSWTSAVPELVWCMISCLVVRRDLTMGTANWILHFGPLERCPRVQVGGELDSIRVEGSGPFGQPYSGYPRGCGTATKMCSVGTGSMHMLPPGAHTFRLIAAQTADDWVNTDTDPVTMESSAYADDGPIEGICIGSRQVIVFRFPFGGQLPA